MPSAFSRLIHSIKVTGGTWVSHLLRWLQAHGKGPTKRLVDGRNPSPSCGWSYRSVTKAAPLPSVEPALYPKTPLGTDYLERINTHGAEASLEAGIISANHVDLSLPIGMHQHQGRVFDNALLGSEVLANPKYVLDLEALRFRTKTEQSEAILLTLPWHHNFYHWMIEILPRLALVDRRPDLDGLLLVAAESSPGFVRQSLEMTGYLDRVTFLPDGVHHFSKLHIPTRLSDTSDVSPVAIDWLNAQFVKSPAKPSRRLYLSRADAKIRFVANEADLEPVLAEFGFETVVMGNYSLAEQIRLFQEAEMVIGSHGAAFAHVAFMQPGTTFVEIFEAGHFNRAFHRLASLRQLRYGFLVGQPSGLGFTVDPAEVAAVLEQAVPCLDTSVPRVA